MNSYPLICKVKKYFWKIQNFKLFCPSYEWGIYFSWNFEFNDQYIDTNLWASQFQVQQLVQWSYACWRLDDWPRTGGDWSLLLLSNWRRSWKERSGRQGKGTLLIFYLIFLFIWSLCYLNIIPKIWFMNFRIILPKYSLLSRWNKIIFPIPPGLTVDPPPAPPPMMEPTNQILGKSSVP